VPITIGVLTGLFLIQRRGTSAIGKLFGPVMFVWFITLGAFGIISIAQTPEVLNAINPAHAVRFGIEHPFGMFLLMAAVFLSLTGAEALYADMGHFGPKPIRWAWFGLICPGLLLNYFGQGALMLRTHHAGENPFFMLVPLDALLIPMVVLATAATVIASQSTLSGAFSMTQQAMRMGYLPRLYVRHTSDQQRGQIYIPAVNWLLMVSVILLVFLFQSSDHLAAAYGVAVSGTMIITTLLAILVTVIQKPEKRFLLLGFLIVFALLELLFFTANMTKIFSGGWFPLLFGVALFVMLSTWKRGSTLVADYRHKFDIPMDAFIASTLPDVPRVPGTAIYLTADPTLVPSALFHSLKHFKVMHERTVFLHVSIADVPHVSKSERTHMRQPADGIYDVTVKFGFRQETDLPDALKDLETQGLTLEPMLTTFFVSRANVTEGTHPKMRRWRFSLFAWMTRQSEGAAGFFHLPANQVVELGTKVML
jgi:KUP system potassium uptake protein